MEELNDKETKIVELQEEYAKKKDELREKYADIINDLSIKYDKDLGVALEMLESIPRALVLGLEPKYDTTIEFDAEELIQDYAELESLSIEIAKLRKHE